MRTVHVCSTVGCPQLAPCPTHSRPTNAPWSKGRDFKAHASLRRQVIKERGPSCQRCTWTTTPDGRGLHMHHVRPGDQAANVILLCAACHRKVDTSAR